MKRIGFIDARRITGRAPQVKLIPHTKRGVAGAVVFTAAPNTKTTVTGGVAKAMTISPTLGVTGTGGRNFVRGKYVQVGTGKQTLSVLMKTLAGVTKALATATGTPTASTTTTATNWPIPAPVTVVLKGAGATKVKTLQALTLSVNALTTVMM